MEGQWAVLVGEGGAEDVVSRLALPVDVREGDVLRGGRRDTVCRALLREDVLRLLGAR